MTTIFKWNITIAILFGVSNILFSQELPAYVPKSGLIAWYPLDGDATDFSGNNLHGKIFGATPAENREKISAKSLSFSGHQYVEVSNIPALTKGYTYSAWLKGSDVNEDCGIVVQKGPATNGSFGLSCYKNTYNCRHRNKEKKLVSVNQSQTIVTTIWHHLVTTWDGQNLKLYIDGKLQNTQQINTNYEFSPYLHIGALNVGDKVGYFYKGLIDDVGVWNRALSQKEIKTLHENTNSIDEGNNENNSKATNNSTRGNEKENSINQEIASKEKNSSEEKKTPLPVIKVKDRNSQSQLPLSLLIFDKENILEIGNSVQVTRNETINIPGERRAQLVPTILGIGKITEKTDKIYTVKIDNLTAQKMAEYKDGDDNFFCALTEDKKVIVAKPRIMVIPRTLDPELFTNGEYNLNEIQRKITSALKNKLEDNTYTTIGFESTLKKIYEDRLINENTKGDIKSMILEASGADFYVEYDVFNSKDCVRTLEFKIRNYATGEDVASDIKNVNTCGTPDDYKNFASDLLNDGSLSKIDKEFNSLQLNGRKISLNFNLSSETSKTFTSTTNGFSLEEHIENCLQSMSFNGNYKSSGSVSNRISFPEVSISPTNDTTGKNYTPNAFAIDIVKYLKDNAGVDCEKTVIGSNINITIK
jgi:hypothetical protein